MLRYVERFGKFLRRQLNGCDSVCILGKRESKYPEFQKEYLKVVGEEPAPVMPDEMENLVKDNFRAIAKPSRFSKELATNV